MASISMNFSLRTSSNCKTVHLLGSWDNYVGQLPLSKDSKKSGAWKGTFKFQGSSLRAGQRYWYYYIIDGHHVSHDPAKDHVVEPTTGRKLNTLDVAASTESKQSSRDKERSRRHSSHRASTDVAKGRALDPSQIKSPKPVNPAKTRKVLNGDYAAAYTYEQLAAQLQAVQLAAQYQHDEADSDAESDVPSLSSSRASSPSSVSSSSSLGSYCSCERYGITRGGDRVKLDCKGSRCGSSDESECESESDSEAYSAKATRRHGIYMRR